MTSWIGVKVTAPASSRNLIGGRSAAMRWRYPILKRDHWGGGETSRVLGERIELRLWIGKENGALTPTDCFRCHRRTRSVPAVGRAMVRVKITGTEERLEYAPWTENAGPPRFNARSARTLTVAAPFSFYATGSRNDGQTKEATERGADVDADVDADADVVAVVKAVVDVVVDPNVNADGCGDGVDADPDADAEDDAQWMWMGWLGSMGIRVDAGAVVNERRFECGCKGIAVTDSRETCVVETLNQSVV
ncbi:hypothetical protein SISSUDRAFT_1038289 [Sistotremastrum suecicum HHB10207 ss-3]|uniref:Uncharacterized protein n=1 Tax=Sistotremastrum suecicum HHB10207 ss-3 TaxID=1314776 RepID=A0A165WYJ2_9AGAM|nr:hypothetical protein SISSUDRAFT_1038289 [Sistotremastrum suecicum HHB10207 ss-3]